MLSDSYVVLSAGISTGEVIFAGNADRSSVGMSTISKKRGYMEGESMLSEASAEGQHDCSNSGEEDLDVLLADDITTIVACLMCLAQLISASHHHLLLSSIMLTCWLHFAFLFMFLFTVWL